MDHTMEPFVSHLSVLSGNLCISVCVCAKVIYLWYSGGKPNPASEFCYDSTKSSQPGFITLSKQISH